MVKVRMVKNQLKNTGSG